MKQYVWFGEKSRKIDQWKESKFWHNGIYLTFDRHWSIQKKASFTGIIQKESIYLKRLIQHHRFGLFSKEETINTNLPTPKN